MKKYPGSSTFPVCCLTWPAWKMSKKGHKGRHRKRVVCECVCNLDDCISVRVEGLNIYTCMRYRNAPSFLNYLRCPFRFEYLWTFPRRKLPVTLWMPTFSKFILINLGMHASWSRDWNGTIISYLRARLENIVEINDLCLSKSV